MASSSPQTFSLGVCKLTTTMECRSISFVLCVPFQLAASLCRVVSWHGNMDWQLPAVDPWKNRESAVRGIRGVAKAMGGEAATFWRLRKRGRSSQERSAWQRVRSAQRKTILHRALSKLYQLWDLSWQTRGWQVSQKQSLT